LDICEGVECAELGDVEAVVLDARGVWKRMGVEVITRPAERRPVEA
jgi:hypothetical protein